MDFKVLGPVEVCRGGQSVGLRSAKQRVLLAALLVDCGRVVPVVRLIDLLWGEHPPLSARNSLQTYVSRLRAQLGGAKTPLETRGQGYVLEIAPEQLDATRFQHLLTTIRAQLASEPGAALALADEALGLWQGRAFGDLAEHPVARAAALRLEELRAVAMEAHAEALLALDRHGDAVAELEAITAAAPLRERPHEQLMRALTAGGRVADALGVQRAFRRRMVDELGVEPSARLRALEQEILRQSPQLFPTPAQSPSRPKHKSGALPRPTGSLHGRDADVENVVRTLDSAPLVTVAGAGGVGKSRLALQVATTLERDHGWSARWCELATVHDQANVGHAVANALDVVVRGGTDPVESLLAVLRTQDVLVVLDNCEHVVDGLIDVLGPLLRHCADLQVLATSRERLGLDGERVYRLRPLAVPAADQTATKNASVRLFVERAHAVRPDFRLTEGNAAAVAEVCRRLDGLPLAIELAAARSAALTPADLAARLDARFELLAGARRGGNPRHLSLVRVIDWSYELLSEPHRRLFERLSLFAGGFSLPLAEQLSAHLDVPSDQVAPLLAALVDKSLVVGPSDDEPPRYALLESLRLYGRQQLGRRDDAADAARAHARVMLDLAEVAEQGLRGADEASWVRRVDSDLGNLRSAMAWARDAIDVDAALGLASSLHRYASWRLRTEVLDWAEPVLALPGAADHPAWAGASATAAIAAILRGDLAAADEHARRGLQVVSADDPARARLLEHRGDVALFAGRFDDAFSEYGAAAAIAAHTGDAQTRTFNLVGQALAACYAGDTARALELAEQARAAAERSANPSALGWAVYTRGEALMSGEPAQALELLEEAGRLARSVHNEFLAGVAMVSAVSLRGRVGTTHAALRGFRQLAQRWQQSGTWTQAWTTLRNLVELLARTHPIQPAAVLYGAAVAASTPVGAEALRLHAAATRLEDCIGTQAFHAALAIGQQMDPADAVHFAIDTIDHLLPLADEPSSQR